MKYWIGTNFRNAEYCINNKIIVIFLFVGLFLNLSNCKFDEKHDDYPFSIKLEGPFLIKDILNFKDVTQKSGILLFDSNIGEIYVFRINNTSNDTLFAQIYSSIGSLLNEVRYFSNKINGKYELLSNYGISDHAPWLIDPILPGQQKNYYASIECLEEGFVEVYLNVRSTYIDSLNAIQNHKFDFHIKHPSLIYEVKNKTISKKIDKKIYKNVVPKQ